MHHLTHLYPTHSLPQAATKPALINATLQSLQRYVTWIPDSYVFETRLLETLILKYLPRTEFRVNTLMVLASVGGLAKPQYDRVFEQLYLGVMGQLVRFLPSDASLKRAYEGGTPDDQLFLRHLALFLTGFFRAHVELLEPEHLRPVLLAGMGYLVQLTDVDDPEVFKICLEYWLRLANDLYAAEVTYVPSLPSLGGMPLPGATYVDPVTGQTRAVAAAGGGVVGAAGAGSRKAIYAETLSRVREVMIAHMAKPEEVLIEEDDSGEIVRETTKDTDAIATYKVRRRMVGGTAGGRAVDGDGAGQSSPLLPHSLPFPVSLPPLPRSPLHVRAQVMKDTLVYLTHLDTVDTENIMLDKLSKQVSVPARERGGGRGEGERDRERGREGGRVGAVARCARWCGGAGARARACL
jgi:hypothetical protein